MSYYDDIYEAVQRIPAGRVSTYGRIAAMCTTPRGARGVGYALHALSGAQARSVPWWRVVNVAGRISNEYNAPLQRALLEEEGILFSVDDHIDLRRFLWTEPVT